MKSRQKYKKLQKYKKKIGKEYIFFELGFGRTFSQRSLDSKRFALIAFIFNSLFVIVFV
jgi:hypothetical protein